MYTYRTNSDFYRWFFPESNQLVLSTVEYIPEMTFVDTFLLLRTSISTMLYGGIYGKSVSELLESWIGVDWTVLYSTVR